MTKTLPREITSYDLLKAAAVVLMIADHAGYFFFPEDNWWRVAGRMCVPVWFFFIGYAKSRDLGPKLWIGAAILVGANFIAGMSVIPFNILATMIIVRLLIDGVARRAFRSESFLWPLMALMFLLIVPTMFVTEYGTQGLILALFGYAVRHRDALQASGISVQRYGLAAYFAFIVPQFFFFGFTPDEFLVMGLGVLAVMALLYNFRPLEFPKLTAALPRVAVWLLHTGGRRTAEIYVLHLLLFKFMALWLQPERFGLFDWEWFSPTGS